MKNILIIYPHWPPSNLAGVHRARLIANFLPEMGWHPVVLTVHPDYYEEKPDWELLKTVSPKIEVHTVKACKIRRPRIIGDIGLRAFFQLKREALRLLKQKKTDFIWIPIPSFYTAVLGRLIHSKTQIPYGIDYIDPWVRDISNRKSLRSILSIVVARMLEPYAIHKAALVSGVAEAYFKPAIERNFKANPPIQIAMPYGFDPGDHLIKLEQLNYPWDNDPDCIPYIYAGAFLPLSGLFINLLFKSIAKLKGENNFDKRIKIFFLGTGNYTHRSITSYAIEHGIADHIVEKRERYAYLHILNFLSGSKGVLLLGSTEKHYTASKTFQSVLSGKPVFTILHAQSTVVEILLESETAEYLVKYENHMAESDLLEKIETTFSRFLNEKKPSYLDFTKLDKYSAKQSAKTLVQGIEFFFRNSGSNDK